MSSQLKIDSARANGAKSRGPVSIEGKRRSSINGLIHCLAANTVCYGSEDKPAYHAKLLEMREWVQPRNPYEDELVELVVKHRHREHRADALESAGMDIRMIRMRDAVDAEFPSIDPQGRTALAFSEEANTSNMIPLLVRYSRDANRKAERAWVRLLRVRPDLVDFSLDEAICPSEPKPETEDQSGRRDIAA